MNTRTLNDILTWMRTTDLVELAFKKGSQGFEFRTEGAPPANSAFPSSALVPISAPTVGVFRSSRPGSASGVSEGASVSVDGFLGLIETGENPAEIKASCSGRVLKILAQDGDPVEYGQPLFLIAP